MLLFLYILGVFLSFFTFLIASKIMVYDGYDYKKCKERKPLKFRRWQWLLIIIASLIPILNYCLCIMIFPICSDYKVSDQAKEKFNKSLIRRLVDFMNEEV